MTQFTALLISWETPTPSNQINIYSPCAVFVYLSFLICLFLAVVHYSYLNISTLLPHSDTHHSSLAFASHELFFFLAGFN